MHCRRHLRDETRHENESAFAYIFSDTIGWTAFFLLLYSRPRERAVLKLTIDRVVTNISDTGKAFVIILCSDIFLG